MAKRLVLASGSPRRRMLLEQAGLDFEVIVSDADEHFSGKDPAHTVRELSLRKAESVSDMSAEDGIILAADTVVAYDGNILGKPHNEEDAFHMLKMLQGNTHQVYTGVTIICKSNGRSSAETFDVCTDVVMYEASDQEILGYIQTGEPSDKAGAYAIQGKGFYFVKEIRGDYNNVVGLPTLAIRQVARLVRATEA